jgi:hypothetical protein
LNELQLGEFIYEQPAVGDTGYVFRHIRHGVFSWRGPFAGQDSPTMVTINRRLDASHVSTEATVFQKRSSSPSRAAAHRAR